MRKKIDEYLDILRNHFDFDVTISFIDDKVIMAETPYNQKWELGIQILFSSIYKNEKFYVNFPSLNISGDKLNKFTEEMVVVTKIVNDLNNLIDEWRKEND